MTDYQLPPQPSPLSPDEEQDLRARAQKRLKAKRDLKGHVLAYVLINLAFVGVWYLAGGGFFWPVFIIVGWGIGLAFNIYDVLTPEPGPDEVRAEMERLRQQR